MANFYNSLLSLGKKTILIFDNADDKYGNFNDSKLAKYFPMSLAKHHLQQGYKDPYIIVTTRKELFLHRFDSTRIQMQPFATRKALQLCKTSLKSYKNATMREQERLIPEMKRLCSCLRNYPLAVQQAIAYLNEMMEKVDIDDFIEKYKKNVKVYEDKESQVGYSYTLATMFGLNVGLIGKADSAIEMMYILSFCKAEGTGIGLFYMLYEKAIANEAAAKLENFNLLAVSDAKKIFVHRVVQKVVRDLVLGSIELIEVVLMAAFVDEGCGKFPILETLKENNQHIDSPNCELNKIFLQHWELIQTNKLAASAVMMIGLCRLEAFRWKAVFGKKNWEDACSVLERTCFHAITQNYDCFPKEVENFVKKLTEQDANKGLILCSFISIALESLDDESKWTKDLKRVRKKFQA